MCLHFILSFHFSFTIINTYLFILQKFPCFASPFLLFFKFLRKKCSDRLTLGKVFDRIVLLISRKGPGRRRTMNLLTVEDVTIISRDKVLIDHISFGLNEGDKAGIIGINGTGKSTLLKVAANIEEPDSGMVTKGNAVRLAYLPQNPEFDNSKTVLENVTGEKNR